MTKILNKRPLFFCFIALGFGIYFANPILSLNAITIAFVSIALIAISYLCIRYKVVYSLLLIFVCFTIGVGTFLISQSNFNATEYGDSSLNITGRVSVVTNYDGSQNLILDNVIVNQDEINSCVCVSIYSFGGYQEGDVITFNSQLKRNSLFTLGKFNSYNYKYNVAYSTTANVEEITIIEMNKLQWQESLRLNVKRQLFGNMKPTEASVSYASLFGDKAYVEDDIKSDFSISGISHLLAVSGLHVGFVVALISLILKKLKANKYVNFSFICILLGLYCFICNFSSSVLRATIMFIVFEVARLLGKRYDRLNAWSVAGLICLFYKPLSVYDGGFLLSFACVLCIFMFAKPIEQKLILWHLPKKLASILGVMLPIQIGLLPLLSAYYSQVSLFSIFVNLICVPIFEVFFMLLFALCILALIFPFLNFLFAVPGFIIGSIIQISSFFANIKWSIISLTKFTSLFIVGIYATMFICSHFTNIKAKAKTIVSCIFIGICALCMVLSSYKLLPSNNKVTVLNYSGETFYALQLNGKSFVIGDFNKYSCNFAKNYVIYERLYKVDYYISLNDFIPNENIFTNIYCPNQDGITSFVELEDYMNFTEIYYSGKLFGVLLKSSDTKIFILANNEINRLKCEEFANLYDDIDLVFSENKSADLFLSCINYNSAIINGNNIITNDGSKTMIGNFSFNISNNKLSNIRGAD